MEEGAQERRLQRRQQANRNRIRSMVLSSCWEKVMRRKENQYHHESSGKTSGVWNEHRPCLAFRRALEILSSELG